MHSWKKSHEWGPQQVFDSRYVPSCVSPSCKEPIHYPQTRIRNLFGVPGAVPIICRRFAGKFAQCFLETGC